MAYDEHPVNVKLKRASESIINTFSVCANITYDGTFNHDNFSITVLDINNNLYMIEWNDYTIISNQVGVFVNKEFPKDQIPKFLSEITRVINSEYVEKKYA